MPRPLDSRGSAPMTWAERVRAAYEAWHRWTAIPGRFRMDRALKEAGVRELIVERDRYRAALEEADDVVLDIPEGYSLVLTSAYDELLAITRERDRYRAALYRAEDALDRVQMGTLHPGRNLVAEVNAIQRALQQGQADE